MSQLIPEEINVLEPLMIQSSPSRTPVVLIPARSLPAPGSVMAIATMVSPVMMPGSQRAFCSSFERLLKYGPTTSFCRDNAGTALPHSGEFLGDDGIEAEVVRATSAILLWHVEPDEAVLAGSNVRRLVDDSVALPLFGVRGYLPLQVLPGGLREAARARRRRSVVSCRVTLRESVVVHYQPCPQSAKRPVPRAF